MVASALNTPPEEIDDTVHLLLRLGAKANRLDNLKWSTEDRIRAFHIAMKAADPDWPFSLAHYDCDCDGIYTVNEFCHHCGGVVYTAPMISPAEIIALSNQLGLVIKKMRYMRECDCTVFQGIRAKPDEEKATTELVSTEAELIEEVLSPTDSPEKTEHEAEKADAKAVAASTSGYGFAAIEEYEKGTKLSSEVPPDTGHNSNPPSWESCMDSPSWEKYQYIY